MKIQSLDPRISRAQLDTENKQGQLSTLDHWPTFEVFHQKKRGTHHQHVGSVHAPNAEMAVLFAKEQYGRRGVCVNMWVVKTQDIFTTDYEDDDIFATTPEKLHREPDSYKVIDRINAFKKRQEVEVK